MFRPGDYIVNVRETLSGDLQEEVIRYKEYLHNEPSEYFYIEKLTLYKIEKLDRGIYWLNNPSCLTVLTEDKKTWQELYTVDHGKGAHFKFKKETYDKLLRLNPMKFKIGDKVLNPLLKYSFEDINTYQCDNDFTDITIYSEKSRNQADERGKLGKSFPFLYVKNIEPIVSFNFKYGKFLFMLEHKYFCRNDTPDFDLQVSVTTYEDKKIQPYNSLNSIWNTVCTSQSQET